MGKLKLKQKLKQIQKGYLSLESKLFIKLIKLNIEEINELLEKEIVENPCLDEIEIKDLASSKASNESIDEINYEEIVQYDDNNISAYLIKQIKHLDLLDKDKIILACFAYLLDDKGFLQYTNNELKEILKTQEKIDIDENEIEKIILSAQNILDPPGIMARDVKESLKKQLKLSNNENSQICTTIINQFLHELSKKDYKVIAKSLQTSISRIRKCVQDITELNMNPANIFYRNQRNNRNPEPEAHVYNQNNQLVVQINKGRKKLQISNYYKNMLKSKVGIDKEVKEYLKEKISAGTLLLKTINEREDIYREVVNMVVQIQKDYILKGDRFLKPLKLSDIASEVGVHESTISRITSNKYIRTPNGIINMKSFFINKPNKESGQSSIAIRDIILEIISNENKNTPFSDLELKEILEKRRIIISRRTIAKYRNILRIPSSSKRGK